MTHITRRQALTGSAALATAAIASPAFAASREAIHRRIDNAILDLERSAPNVAPLLDSSAGVILIPRVRGGGLGIGGAYGEGALLINREPVDYYALATASFGIQVGIQQYHTALFLRTEETLAAARRHDGWTAGVDLEYTAIDIGENLDYNNAVADQNVYGAVFGKKGLLVGATLEGAKYSRIVR